MLFSTAPQGPQSLPRGRSGSPDEWAGKTAQEVCTGNISSLEKLNKNYTNVCLILYVLHENDVM